MLIVDKHYISSPDLVEVYPDVRALKELRDRGVALVSVSNQSGIKRGYFTWDDLERVTERVKEELARLGVIIDAFYYCPDLPWEDSDCRKPRPGMLLRAAAELGLDLNRCVMIGDQDIDVRAGRAAGCATVLLVRPDNQYVKPEDIPRIAPDHVSGDLWDAVAWSLRRLGVAT